MSTWRDVCRRNTRISLRMRSRIYRYGKNYEYKIVLHFVLIFLLIANFRLLYFCAELLATYMDLLYSGAVEELRMGYKMVLLFRSLCPRGVATGWISGFIPPPKKKSAEVNFLWGKNDVRTAVQQFYTPSKNLYPPPKKKQISGYAPVVSHPTKLLWACVPIPCRAVWPSQTAPMHIFGDHGTCTATTAMLIY